MHSFTYRLCKRLIENDRTDNMYNKLDVFLKKERITKEEYTELLAMLPLAPQEVI